ncbi:MAG: PQQ-binding-like beta-propeller repeat protein [Phycisphaerae bacterium]|nr:PQQ-binding-like beta-propeller repeat protein [Phycisphaerae bacterium]
MRRTAGQFLTIAAVLAGVGAGSAGEPPKPDSRLAAPPAWPIHRGDRALTGRARGTLRLPLRTVWTAKLGAGLRSSPVVAGGQVLIGSARGIVRAFDADDGTERWARDVGEPVDAPPCAHAGRVYVGGADGGLHCLDADDGTVHWTYRTGAKIVGSPNWAYVVDKTETRALRIVVGSYDNKLHCVDADGHRVWTYETENFINGTPAIAARRVLFGGCDANVYAVALTDGARHAAVDTGSYIAASPAVDGDDVYVGHYGGRFVRVDLAAGRVAWRYGAGEDPFFSSPALADDRVVVGGRDGKVHCIARADGTKLWTFATGGMVDAAPVICGDNVVVGSDDATLYVLDLSDGTKLWSQRLSDRITTSPAVAAPPAAASGTKPPACVWVACDDGTLHALQQAPPPTDEPHEDTDP